MDSSARSRSRGGQKDLKYEFDAPHFFDFTRDDVVPTREGSPESDAWFESPAAQLLAEAEVLIESSSPSETKDYQGPEADSAHESPCFVNNNSIHRNVKLASQDSSQLRSPRSPPPERASDKNPLGHIASRAPLSGGHFSALLRQTRSPTVIRSPSNQAENMDIAGLSKGPESSLLSPLHPMLSWRTSPAPAALRSPRFGKENAEGDASHVSRDPSATTASKPQVEQPKLGLFNLASVADQHSAQSGSKANSVHERDNETGSMRQACSSTTPIPGGLEEQAKSREQDVTRTGHWRTDTRHPDEPSLKHQFMSDIISIVQCQSADATTTARSSAQIRVTSTLDAPNDHTDGVGAKLRNTPLHRAAAGSHLTQAGQKGRVVVSEDADDQRRQGAEEMQLDNGICVPAMAAAIEARMRKQKVDAAAKETVSLEKKVGLGLPLQVKEAHSTGASEDQGFQAASAPQAAAAEERPQQDAGTAQKSTQTPVGGTIGELVILAVALKMEVPALSGPPKEHQSGTDDPAARMCGHTGGIMCGLQKDHPVDGDGCVSGTRGDLAKCATSIWHCGSEERQSGKSTAAMSTAEEKHSSPIGAVDDPAGSRDESKNDGDDGQEAELASEEEEPHREEGQGSWREEGVDVGDVLAQSGAGERESEGWQATNPSPPPVRTLASALKRASGPDEETKVATLTRDQHQDSIGFYAPGWDRSASVPAGSDTAQTPSGDNGAATETEQGHESSLKVAEDSRADHVLQPQMTQPAGAGGSKSRASQQQSCRGSEFKVAAARAGQVTKSATGKTVTASKTQTKPGAALGASQGRGCTTPPGARQQPEPKAAACAAARTGIPMMKTAAKAPAQKSAVPLAAAAKAAVQRVPQGASRPVQVHSKSAVASSRKAPAPAPCPPKAAQPMVFKAKTKSPAPSSATHSAAGRLVTQALARSRASPKQAGTQPKIRAQEGLAALTFKPGANPKPPRDSAAGRGGRRPSLTRASAGGARQSATADPKRQPGASRERGIDCTPKIGTANKRQKECIPSPLNPVRVLHSLLPAPQVPKEGDDTMQQATSSEAASRLGHHKQDVTRMPPNKQGPLTAPVSPSLETRKRNRLIKAKTSEEIELEELAHHPKFRARPVDPRILESHGEIGIPHLPKRPLTKPQEFHLHVDQRAQVRGSQLAHESSQEQLKPKATPKPLPVGKSALHGIHSFGLQTDVRSELKRQRMQEKVQAEVEVETSSRIPKARGIPLTTTHPQELMKPTPKPLTAPQPFNLRSVARHEVEVKRRQQQLQEEAAREEEERHRGFHARPMPNFDALPQRIPEPERQPMTRAEDGHRGRAQG